MWPCGIILATQGMWSDFVTVILTSELGKYDQIGFSFSISGHYFPMKLWNHCFLEYKIPLIVRYIVTLSTAENKHTTK